MGEKIQTIESRQITPATLSAEIVKQYICPLASDQEIMYFLQLCKAQNLNPFLKEVYLIKYPNYPATIVTGKETFTKRAARIKEFLGFKAGVIYGIGEDIRYKEGAFIPPGGKLLGGWADVKRSDKPDPFRSEISLDEYIQTKNDGSPNKFWKEKAATMARKVALVQALREAFPDEFEGLYSPEEMPLKGDLPEYSLDNPIGISEPISTTGEEPPNEIKKEPPPLEPPPDDTDKKTNKDILDDELSSYAMMESGEIDMNLYETVLKEVSRFEGKDQKGNKKEYFIESRERLFHEKVSEAWAGKAIGELRKKLGKNGK